MDTHSRTKSLSSDLKSDSNLLFWPKSERPRERLLQLGVSSLSTAEVLAILLGQGRRGANAVDLAREVIKVAGNRSLYQVTSEELCLIKGVGPSKAARILAGLELAKRAGRVDSNMTPSFHTSQKVYDWYSPKLKNMEKEVFICISVDVKNRLISAEEIAKGSQESVVFSPKDLFFQAILQKASGVICIHNHPSGDPSPSPEDKNLTQRLKEGACVLGLRFLDHVIIGREKYYSFADQGWGSRQVVTCEVLFMGKTRRGGYVFITWIGDHDHHVHVYQDGRPVMKYNLETKEILKGKLNRLIIDHIEELQKEGILYENSASHY